MTVFDPFDPTPPMKRTWTGPSGRGSAKTDARNRTRLRKRLRAQGISEEVIAKHVDDLARQQREARALNPPVPAPPGANQGERE